MIKLEYPHEVFKLWDTDGYKENQIALFSKELAAQTIAFRLNGNKKHGYFGYSKIRTPCTIIFESIAEYEDWKNNSVKEKALAKLTKEEKEALGLL